jgi:hypothetical protein
LRKFALLALACAVLSFTNFASAQQGDIMLGGSILLSPTVNNDSVNFQPPAEKGGTYFNVSGDFIKFKHRLGFNAETSWRYKRGDYPDNGQSVRPFLTDFNVLFQPRLNKKFGLDLFAGIGIASYRFSLPEATSCTIPTGGCTFFNSSNHFLEDLGGGVRYYVWHRLSHIYIRPEVHYYHIQNNVEFNSPNLFRVGASLGYTFGSE